MNMKVGGVIVFLFAGVSLIFVTAVIFCEINYGKDATSGDHTNGKVSKYFEPWVDLGKQMVRFHIEYIPLFVRDVQQLADDAIKVVRQYSAQVYSKIVFYFSESAKLIEENFPSIFFQAEKVVRVLRHNLSLFKTLLHLIVNRLVENQKVLNNAVSRTASKILSACWEIIENVVMNGQLIGESVWRITAQTVHRLVAKLQQGGVSYVLWETSKSIENAVEEILLLFANDHALVQKEAALIHNYRNASGSEPQICKPCKLTSNVCPHHHFPTDHVRKLLDKSEAVGTFQKINKQIRNNMTASNYLEGLVDLTESLCNGLSQVWHDLEKDMLFDRLVEQFYEEPSQGLNIFKVVTFFLLPFLVCWIYYIRKELRTRGEKATKAQLTVTVKKRLYENEADKQANENSLNSNNNNNDIEPTGQPGFTTRLAQVHTRSNRQQFKEDTQVKDVMLKQLEDKVDMSNDDVEDLRHIHEMLGQAQQDYLNMTIFDGNHGNNQEAIAQLLHAARITAQFQILDERENVLFNRMILQVAEMNNLLTLASDEDETDDDSFDEAEEDA